MNSLRPLALLSSRSIFSHGARTTIGGVRYAGTAVAAAAAASAAAAARTGGGPGAGAAVATTPAPRGRPVKLTGEARFNRPGYKPRSVRPPGHAERIWVHHHILANLTVYSLPPEMNPTKAFRQFAFTGKKLVPAKLRKDYWRPLAVVEFGEGAGEVGRSVYHKMRELKKRHLLEWDDPALLRMSRHERGKALNDQRGIFVADLAAVLAGRGKGNRVIVAAPEPVDHKTGRGARVAGGKQVAKDTKGGEAVEKEAPLKLHGATVYWANEQDKYFAREWSDNVTHVIGLPEKVAKKAEDAVEEAAPAETEAATEAAPEAPKAE